MPIQLTQTFTLINGVLFPDINEFAAPIDDVFFGADSTGTLQIYDYELLPNPIWRLPTMQEKLDNIPNYVNKEKNVIEIMSTNSLNPQLIDFRLIGRGVEMLSANDIFTSEYTKAPDSDTIVPTSTDGFLPNQIYKAILN